MIIEVMKETNICTIVIGYWLCAIDSVLRVSASEKTRQKCGSELKPVTHWDVNESGEWERMMKCNFA